MVIFLVLCAMVCLGGIVWATSNPQLHGDAKTGIGVCLMIGALVLFTMAGAAMKS